MAALLYPRCMLIVFGNFVEVIGVWPLLKPSTRFRQRIEGNSSQNLANRYLIVAMDLIHFFLKNTKSILDITTLDNAAAVRF